MRKQKLRIGIAGYGVVGRRRHHYINEHPELEVVAVCDKRFEHEENTVKNLRSFVSFKELLKEKLDILFVCLPNFLAPEVTMAGIENGLHVFCEKPPGRTVEDIEAVITVAKKYPALRIKYGFNHRYHESVKEAIRLIQFEEFGPIVSIRGLYGKSVIIPYEEGGWRSERKYSGGGILLDQGIHMVDLLRLFGGDFIEVKSFISNNFWNFDVEDNAYALLRGANNTIAMLHSSATQWQHRFSLELNFKQAFLKLEGILSGTKSYGEETLTLGRRTKSNTGNLTHSVTRYLTDTSWRDEIFEFADAILYNKPIVNGSADDALQTMRLVYAIYNADESWQKKLNRYQND